MNTIYLILRVPSLPCAVCVNLLVPPWLQEPGLPPGAGHCRGVRGTPGSGCGGPGSWPRIKPLPTLSIPMLPRPPPSWALLLAEVGRELGGDGGADAEHPEHPMLPRPPPRWASAWQRGQGSCAPSRCRAGGAGAALRRAPPGSLGAQRDV